VLAAGGGDGVCPGQALRSLCSGACFYGGPTSRTGKDMLASATSVIPSVTLPRERGIERGA
jgi:hypothetical protein